MPHGKYKSHHPKLGNKPGVTNWVEKAGGLPGPIDAVARALRAKGWTKSRAIATAVNHVRKVCTTGRAFGGRTTVSPQARAKACAAAARWEAMKLKAKADTSIPVQERRAIDLAFKRVEGDALTIDLAEKRITAKEREKAPTAYDGAFPIRNKGELRRAILAYGRAPADKKAKVKAFIVRRARELGASEMLPAGWK